MNKVIVVNHPCVVTVSQEEGQFVVQIETKVSTSFTSKLRESLVGPNRPFETQKDLIAALLEESEFAGNKYNGMKVTVSQLLSGARVSERTLHAVSKAYLKRTGRILDI